MLRHKAQIHETTYTDALGMVQRYIRRPFNSGRTTIPIIYANLNMVKV